MEEVTARISMACHVLASQVLFFANTIARLEQAAYRFSDGYTLVKIPGGWLLHGQYHRWFRLQPRCEIHCFPFFVYAEDKLTDHAE